MAALCATQERLRQLCLTAITRPEGRSLASLLLVGHSGAGKRLLARSLATALDTEFIEIPLDSTATSLRTRLFGTQSECARADETEESPGELAVVNPCVFYLSHLEKLPEEMHQELQRLLSQRIYQDLIGRDWKLSDDVILVGGLRDDVAGTVTREHWLVQQFDSDILVTIPQAAEELQQIVVSMLNDAESAKSFAIKPEECISIAQAASGNLHRVRNWLSKAITTKSGPNPLNVSDVWKILDEDAEHLLSHIDYTASTLHVDRFHAWAAQFPNDLRGMPLTIVRHIKATYYVSPKEFQNGIHYLVEAMHLEPNSKVIFCSWQHLGRSAPFVTNEIKNRGHYKVTSQIDLTRPSHEWPNPETLRDQTFLVADDFAGSGQTIRSLFRTDGSILQALLDRYPGCQVKILLLAAYEDAIRDLRELRAKSGGRIAIHVYKLLGTQDCCFTQDSRIFPNAEERDKLRAFCQFVAKKHYPKMPSKHSLGFGGLGSLCVFHNTVPNNTLPIIWYDKEGCAWIPLFPARGLEDEMAV